jgi:hypothetical protein
LSDFGKTKNVAAENPGKVQELAAKRAKANDATAGPINRKSN